ncbi:ABC transporter substrate-binding protein [Bosea caraganae]|nr:ABC transporter substrate-binding protein [Bosea caraganae]RDJ21914.1 ABC transporter substrate-binding protein [Bosea caraganae]
MRRFLSVIALALAFSASAVFANDPPKKYKVTMPVLGDGFHYYPLYIAQAAGFFAEEGIDIDWVKVNGGNVAAAAVMGGSAEVAPIALAHVIDSQQQGGALVAIASVYQVFAMPLVLSNGAIKKSGIEAGMPIDEKVKRLAGLRLGITSPGGSSDALLRSLFLARGMDPDKTVSIQPFGNGASQVAALEKNLTDGFVYPSPAPDIVVAKGLGSIMINPFAGEVPEIRDLPYIVMATTKDIWAKKPDAIRGVMRALAKASAFAQAKPAETKRLVRSYFKDIDDTLYDKVAEMNLVGIPADLRITKEQVEREIDWLNLSRTDKIKLNYGNVVLNEPVEQAKAARQ